MFVDTHERSTAKIPKLQLEKLIGAHVPKADEENDGEWVALDAWDDSPESLDPSLLVEVADTEPPPPVETFERRAG